MSIIREGEVRVYNSYTKNGDATIIIPHTDNVNGISIDLLSTVWTRDIRSNGYENYSIYHSHPDLPEAAELISTNNFVFTSKTNTIITETEIYPNRMLIIQGGIDVSTGRLSNLPSTSFLFATLTVTGY